MEMVHSRPRPAGEALVVQQGNGASETDDGPTEIDAGREDGR